MAVYDFVDGCRFLPTLGGLTDWTVSAAVQGYRTPASAGATDTLTYHYRAESGDLTQWEIGSGVYTAAGTTLARTTIIASSTGAKVNFSSVPQVAIVVVAADVKTTQGQGDNTTNLATTAYVDRVVGTNGPVSMRNRLINGAMQIDQVNNGSSQTIVAAAAVAYTVDMFYASCTGANVTGQQVAGPTGHQKGYQFTGAASVTGILFGQRVESMLCTDLVSNTVAIQAVISNSLLTTVTWTAYFATAIDNFTTKTQIATGTWTVNSTDTLYSATFNAGASAGNGIAIELTVGAQTSGTWKITGCQLELGGVATPFERKHPALELADCLRYFETSYLGVGAVGTATTSGEFLARIFSADGTGVFIIPCVLQAVKRAAPTVTLYSPTTGASGKEDLIGVGGAVTTVNSNITNFTRMNFSVSPDGVTSCAGVAFHYTANARL